MVFFHANHRSSLRAENSTSSDQSMDSSSTFVPSPEPAASVQHRPGYQRLSTSQEEQDTSYRGAADEASGLGIHNVKSNDHAPGIQVSFSEESTPAVPNSAGFMLSPTLSRSSTRKYSPLGEAPEDEGDFHPEGRSRSPSLYQPFTPFPEDRTLRRASRTSTVSPYGPTGGEHPDFACVTKQHFHHARGEWASILILIASVWSTVFSAVWLGLATGKPHYGSMITHNSKLPPSTAALLIAAFAKSIELTFVTSFVAFLGQLLSQRAFRKDSNGITIAEMQMRTWILQPGTLLTHAPAVRYAIMTFLGGLAFAAALLAMVYTTASDALVSPKLRFGPVNHRILYGNVTARFANESYVESQCASPITKETDPLHKGQTCIAIEHNGQAFHNYQQYLIDWTNHLNSNSTIPTDILERPLPVGTLYDNTTVKGSWIYPSDIGEVSKTHKRMVNNVTLAMPHANVFKAATHPRNKILQPKDLDGLGEYRLEASVPSPALNVLCATMTKEELDPMIVASWPAYNQTKFNVTAYPDSGDPILAKANNMTLPNNSTWFNSTAVDDIFGFGEKYGRRAPYFPIIPEQYNTILNYSSFPVVSDTLYLLTTANVSGNSLYALCSMRAFMEPNCSTNFHATTSGGQMYTNCDEDNGQAYSRSHSNHSIGPYSPEWSDVAAQWAIALSLNAGKTNGLASSARLISQFIPTENSLDAKLPSIAEAVGVMAGCTLLIGSFDTPFLHYWNYSTPDSLLEAAEEPFNATVQILDYASGGQQRWQNMFHAVLVSVFLINLVCLGYFITHTGMVTDFIEPQNMFALSLNSPPSQVMEGTCGGGPQPRHYNSTWHIGMNRQEHFYIESPDDPLTRRRRHLTNQDIELHDSKSPISDMYNRLSKKRSTMF